MLFYMEEYKPNNIQNFNFKLNFDYETNSNEGYIKIIKSLKQMNTFLNETNVVQLLLIYHTSKKLEISEHIKKFITLMSIEYINNYSFFLIILELLHIKKYLINTSFDNENIHSNIIINQINIYLDFVKKDYYIIDFITKLENEDITLIQLNNFFSNISLNFSFYYTFDEFYNIFIEKILIKNNNLNFIEKHKDNLKKIYVEIQTLINEIHDITKISKCKTDEPFLLKIKEIIFHMSKL
jgi:hypothetical protein